MSVSVMGVVGAGFMGSRIAESTAVAGKFAIVYEPDDAPLARSRANLGRSVERAVARGKLSADAAAGVLERIVFTTRFEDLCAADAVIEAITEDAKVKGEIFARLDDSYPTPAFLPPTHPRFRSRSWPPGPSTHSGCSGFTSSLQFL